MNASAHLACYADRAVHRRGLPIVENVRLAERTYRVRLECPDLARRIVPGQFVMLRLGGFNDPLLGRALALYDTWQDRSGRTAGVDLVYLVAGKMTGRLAEFRTGQELELWGPLGNGFPPRQADHLILVAGGIGQTPFLALAREALGLRQYGDPPRSVERASRITLLYGARSAGLLAGIDDFAKLGIEVQLSTDDGSCGHHGLVTDLLARQLEERRPRQEIVCCGPEPMMHAVAELAARAEVPCQVSLETPMACGLGICFSCVAKVRDEAGGWDWRRTCVEGPVFDARQIVFD